MKVTTPDLYFASKPRYEILDGLRGVAALIVVAFHLFETYSRGVLYQVLNHGYLAVDFFFILSGFVMGYAYDDRWDYMTTQSFLKRRFIRLHPMVIMGSVLGALFFHFGDSASFPLIKDIDWWKVLLVLFVALTMIPLPKSADIRGDGGFYPLNGAIWSLLWEYIANILYAVFIRKLSKKLLIICVCCFAVFVVILCFNIDIFGVLQARSYGAYTVLGGWSFTPDQIQIGFTRLLYPFFAGLLLSRLKKAIKVNGGFWWCSLLIFILLVMPRIGGTAHYWMNGLYEMICILFLFPFIVAMGAGSSIHGKKSVAICKFLGNISYPLYVTHYPLIYMQMSWAQSHHNLSFPVHIFVAIGVLIVAILIAYASFMLYDLPVRAWLKRKLFTVPQEINSYK